MMRKLVQSVKNILGLMLKILILMQLLFFLSTLGVVALFKFVPVPYTPLMFIRLHEQWSADKPLKLEHAWVPRKSISLWMQKAVISSEDPKFFEHMGFDFEAITKAIEANKRRKIKLGASTISQQTAKNVFLWPKRNYLRKGLEAYFTVLIENIWGKERILEVYLNVIELGPGIYGVGKASEIFFKKPASDLSLAEASGLAAILPNPRKWNPLKPTPYNWRRRGFVVSNLNNFEPHYFDRLLPIDQKNKKKGMKTARKKSTAAPNPKADIAVSPEETITPAKIDNLDYSGFDTR